MKLKGSLGRSDHEMESKMFGAARSVHKKLTTLEFRRIDLASSGICLVKALGIKP